MSIRTVLPFAVLLLIAGNEAAQETKKELEMLQGEWTMVFQESKGRMVPDALLKNVKLTIKGDQWTGSKLGREDYKTTFKIDPSKDPRTIDLTHNSGDEETVMRGIYKLDGDILTMCRTVGDQERPKEFKTTAEAGTLIVWKRAKK